MAQSSKLLQAGSSQIDITPQPGIPLSGYIARGAKSIGVHDPLFASCLVLSDGSKRAAVVSCDLVALDTLMVSNTRRKIQTATGIPFENIMLACTHTHSGPATIFLQDCGEVDPAYMIYLKTKIVEGVTKAASGLRPVQVGCAKGMFSNGVFDRRKPGSPIDPEIGVVYLRDDTQAPVAVLVNYACHPVVLNADNLLISADYPGAARRAVQKDLKAPVLFLTGACGNIDPVQRGTFQLADEFGTLLAQETLQLIAGMHLSNKNPLDVQYKTLNLPVMPAPSLEELKRLTERHTRNRDKALQETNQLLARVENAMLGWTDRIGAQIRNRTIKDNAQTEIQALRMGGVVLLGIAGELFSTIGQNIKQNAGSLQVMICTCTNGSVGYIPDREAYTIASYEVTEAYKYYGDPSVLSPEAGEWIVSEAAALIDRWKKPGSKG